MLSLLSKQWLFAAVNVHNNQSGDIFMYYATFLGQPEVVIPVLAILLLVPALRNWWYFFTALICNICPLLVQQLLKRMFHAPRPLNYFHSAKWIHHLPEWPELLRNSFPSGHSQGAFSFFCFLSLLLPAKYRAFGFVFFIFAITVCYSRLYLAAHFFADVYAGSLIGGLTTTLLYTIMSRYKPANKTL